MLPELKTDIPGPRSRELAKRLRAHESRNVTFVSKDFPIFWERAEGANVWDCDGNRFLDLTSGFGVATPGFGAPYLIKAYEEQSARLYHAMGDVHPTELKVQLCESLSRLTFERWEAGPGKVILASSGFEAVEAALKTAFLHSGKPGVIAFEGSYHGLGFGALAVTGRAEFRHPFRAQLNEFADFVPYPTVQEDLPAVYEKIRQLAACGDFGALIVEPIQGRGGEVVPPDGFLAGLRRLCDECGLLLILDEIYTGFFRTGTWFACEHEKMVPDLLCLGKGMSGSFPISACVGRSSVMDAWPESEGEALHTSTFLGHPVGCALALASIKEWGLNQEFQHSVTQKAFVWKRELEKLGDIGGVHEVRGRGLLWGVELRPQGEIPSPALVGRLMSEGLKQGLILLGGGFQNNVLSLSPSVALELDEIAWAAGKLGRLIRDQE